MSTTTATPARLYEQKVDGGYSGEVTVTAAEGKAGTPVMVFVESELLGNLVLTAGQAVALANALTSAAAEHLRLSV